ncbi:unnamed protein product [Meganyctiphanes norvegica]|uniref:G-protein coupled receptors family 1 profile domain-containing protein n=1 Tax=Meganyctiphanes norvegica TaxID=48144 RepID=A0AAV2QFA4_MEGNR
MAPISPENIFTISKITNETVLSDNENWVVFNHPEFLVPFICLILASACTNYVLMKVLVTSTDIADRLSYLQCIVMTLYVLVNLCDTLSRNFVSQSWLFLYCHVAVFFMVAFFRVIFVLEAMIAIVKNLVVTQALCMKRTNNKSIYRWMATGSFFIGILKGIEKLTLDTMFVHSCHRTGVPVLYTMIPWLLITVITIFVCYIHLVYFVYSKTALQRSRENLSLSSVAITIAGGMFALIMFSVSIYLLSFPSRPHEVVMQVILVSIFPFTHMMASTKLRKAMLNRFKLCSYCCSNNTVTEPETVSVGSPLSPFTLQSVSAMTDLCAETELMHNDINERIAKLSNGQINSSCDITRKDNESFIQTRKLSVNIENKEYKHNRSKSLISQAENSSYELSKTSSLSNENISIQVPKLKSPKDNTISGDTTRYSDIDVDITCSGDGWSRVERDTSLLDPHQHSVGNTNQSKGSLNPETLTVWVTLKFSGRRKTY